MIIQIAINIKGRNTKQQANKKVSLNVLQMMAVHVKTGLLQGGNLARKEHEKLSEFKCSTGYLQKFLKCCRWRYILDCKPRQAS